MERFLLQSLIYWALVIYTIIEVVIAHNLYGHCFNKCLENGHCDDFGCTAGYYGARCKLQCPINCQDGISRRPACTQTTGSCLTGCKPGFYGLICDTKCSSNCLHNVCYQEDGTCLQGCKHSRYGAMCDVMCGKQCANRNCDRSGICSSCEEGVWGLFCGNTCNSNCTGGRCVMSKGGRPECSDGCQSGWRGDYCDISCDDGCLECSQHDGTCRKRPTRDVSICFKWTRNGHGCECCKSGRRGDNCTLTCPNCMSKYFRSQCHYYCKPGFYGEDLSPCSEKCNANCTHGIHKVPVCDSTTGVCSSCQRGYYGDKCQHACSSRCGDGLCDKTTGLCLKCPVTTYGEYCEHNCSSSCKDTLCYRFNGFCVSGCTPGKYGADCTRDCSERCKVSDCTMTSFGNSVCKEGCVDTFWGNYCEEMCPVNCLRCKQLDGQCTACKNGLTGVNCSEVISETSLPKATLLWILFAILLCLLTCIVLMLMKVRQSLRSHSNNMKKADELHATPVKDLIVCQTSSASASSLKPQQKESIFFQKASGIQDDELKSFCLKLVEFEKIDKDPNRMEHFWSNLGVSQEDIPLMSDANIYCTMLKTVPNLQGLSSSQTVHKLIQALTSAEMLKLAEYIEEWSRMK